MQTITEKLMEAEEVCESERAAKNKVDELLKEAQAKITELHNTMGMLKLQLKCTLNEKELCEYKLAKERNNAHMQGNVQQAALTHKALLRSSSTESYSSIQSNSTSSWVTSAIGISSTK